ncbi:alpha,alpha-phosphotrehalase, partial [Salmonella enterica subsp. enterica serovar Weltevreden]|nr:alpha,alpha-phosphotrehalase [Salmonella enterica subsp. enterica serovar Weltevreden]
LAILSSKSLYHSRTPMQCDNVKNAGFTHGEPWISLCDNYTEVHVAAALRDENSVFYPYQKLRALRQTQPVLSWGDD